MANSSTRSLEEAPENIDDDVPDTTRLLSETQRSPGGGDGGGSSNILSFFRSKIGLIVVSCFVLLGSIILILTVRRMSSNKEKPNDPDLVVVKNGAVASEEINCSKIGVDILKEGGSAIDSAIATQLCVGSINAFSAGIGGGGFMIIRDPNGTVEVIDFREEAPYGSEKSMFVKDPELAKFGGLSVGIPGEIRGFEMAHKKYGKLPWRRLFEPSIKLNREGFKIPPELARRLQIFRDFLETIPELAAVYAPNGTVLPEGYLLKRENLADTLETIARDGPDAFYKGRIAQSLVNAIQSSGGIMTLEDLASYEAISKPPLVGYYHGRKVFVVPPPSSGPILLSVLNTLERFELIKDGLNGVNLHRIVESFKFGAAQRTGLGDPKFVNNSRLAEIISKDYAAHVRQNMSDSRTYDPDYYNPEYDVIENHGTAHLSVIDKEQQVVALTSSVNLIFGSRVMDPGTGILLNDQMDDFSIPGIPNAFGLYPSPYNYVAPGKRPLSSCVPTIIDNDGEFELALGGSGGSRILTAALQVILSVYDFDMNILEAINAPRVHHQLLPNQADLESTFPSELIKELESRGHNVSTFDIKGAPRSEIQAVMRFKNGLIHAASDWRKHGAASGY